MYDISTFSTTSIINSAQTASNPAHLTDPGPSFSATGANLHTFPPCASPPPAICSTGTNLEQGQLDVASSGDFEAPRDAEDPYRSRLFDLVLFQSGANIETVRRACGTATLQAGRCGGFVGEAFVRTDAKDLN